MKKFISVTLVLLLLLSFFGCGSSNTKNEHLYNDSAEIKNPIKEVFVPKKTVAFETNGGSYISPKSVYTLESAPTPTKTNYLFDGWYRDSSLRVPVVFPLDVKSDMTIYAKWLKVSDTVKCVDTKIKMGFNDNSSTTYAITPSGFDLQELARRGYKIRISVTFDYCYCKQYDVWLDIGYAGPPKFEVFILNSEGIGEIETDIPASKITKTKTIEYVNDISDIINEKLTLTFYTDNIQNMIYFENIKITYECYK